MRETEAFILAGGYGSRMGELTKETQKCCLPIDGKPCLIHVLENLQKAFGSVDAKIAVAYLADNVKEVVNKGKPNKVDVTYVPHPVGSETIRAFKEVRNLIKGNAIGTAGDEIIESSCYEDLLKTKLETKKDFVIAFAEDVSQVDTHFIGLLDGNKITLYFKPTKDSDRTGYLMDLITYAFDPSIFSYIDKYAGGLRTICRVNVRMIENNESIIGMPYFGRWIHLGYPEDIKKTMNQYQYA